MAVGKKQLAICNEKFANWKLQTANSEEDKYSMKIKVYIVILILTAFGIPTRAQQPTYTIEKAAFSSDAYDEYSPVYYRNGIVFTSNRSSGSFVDYSSASGKSTFDIMFIDTTAKVTWKKAKLFSKYLMTPFNEGPVTFNATGDTIYFSRNLQVDGKFAELSISRNKLGIFSAVYDGNKWIRIRELRFNNEWYNISTPWLSSDGKRLYFASDKPDGYGGSDLYYSEWKKDYWTDPVNMGPVINTKGNESYPYVNPAGELFFSSDGHPGMGGKDIFFSRFADTTWLTPAHLDPPVNSEADDFAIILDHSGRAGYFSSGRGISVDIFQFKTEIPQIFYCEQQRENLYCFQFVEESNISADDNSLKYEWDFGDGGSSAGKSADHCYTGPGIYNVRLNVVKKSTGKEFFTKLSYQLDLRNVEQPYIASPSVAVKGEDIDFNASKSNLPGYEILFYSWQFSDGKRTASASVKHKFEIPGEEEVKLGVIIKEKNTGIISQRSVSKNITVVNTNQEAESHASRIKKSLPEINIHDYDHAVITNVYSAEKDIAQGAVFHVEIMTSRTRLGIDASVFKNIPSKYELKEIYNPNENIFSYIVDREMDLMATLIAYNDMIALGYKSTRVRTYVLENPAEKEIHNLKKIFGLSSDIYFDNFNRLTSSGYLILDQIVRILEKYPEVKLEISVHTDNTGSSSNNIQSSQARAKTMFNYLVNKGIEPSRLITRGMGGGKPIASNLTGAGRKLNRRIEIDIVR